MLIRSLPLLLAASHTAYALKDALPFILLSTESIPSTLSSRQLSTASSLESSLREALESCSASQYIFVEQAGVRTSDLSDSASMPNLARRMTNEDYKSVVQVPEVMGKMDLVQMQILLEEKCGREKVSQKILPLIGEEIKEGKRRAVLREADATLAKDLHAILSNHTSHVLIFSSVPADEDAMELERLRYEMDEPPFQEHMHTDLKRDVSQEVRRQANSSGDNFQDGLPLFEKYQFLSPGIFMGLFVSIMLLLILYVGISAIAGLEVSYMAFSKEMGPAAQKKQQ